MKYEKLLIIASYFDFILSTHINLPLNQKLLLHEYPLFDYDLYINQFFTNFIRMGGLELFEADDVIKSQSYALSQFIFLLKEKNIDLNILKKFVTNFSKFESKDNRSKYILKSGDNLYKAITKKKNDHVLSKVNGINILRSLSYIINNFKNKNCLEKSIQITKIINDHPYEIIGTFLLYKTILKLNKNNNPYTLFKYLINSLENINDSEYKILLGTYDKKNFDKYKLEIIANIDEFVRLLYVNYNNIPIEKGGDIFEFSKSYYMLFSKIISNNYNSRHKIICNNPISVLIVAINTYIQYYYYYTKQNIIPLQNIILHLVSILGYSHHSTILLSYFIYLLDANSFIKKIPQKIFNKIKY
jgi:hypothetical protein